jgi:SAM-dependent methyltransferase
MNSDFKRLNLGAGQTYLPDFVNIDSSQIADLNLDLGSDSLPFQTGSVDLIFSYHTLEHVPDYLFALSEIHRVLKHGAVFYLGLPYATSTQFNLVNPYHLHNFNEFSFDFFDMGKLEGSAAEHNTIHFRKVFHRFNYMGKFNRLPYGLRNWCRNHLFNVVDRIDFGLIAMREEQYDQPIDQSICNLEEFDRYLNARRPYSR